MPATGLRKAPSYRLHKASGQAITTLTDNLGGRKDYLLGRYGTERSRQEYDRIIAWWIANGRTLPRKEDTPLLVSEVVLAYATHCEAYYRGHDGAPTKELANIKAALRPVVEIYGPTIAREFDSLALQAVRQKMIVDGLCRPRINKDVGRIKRCFAWAAARKMVPAAVHHELRTVEGLRAGRTEAVEPPPILPVPVEHVEAVLPHLTPTVRDMARLQLLTGMRSGELVIMRPCDIDMKGTQWLYRPQRHKGTHRGLPRVVALGPQAQEIVRRYLVPQLDAYLFSPRRSLEEWRAMQRERRKTPVPPSQHDRRKRTAKKRAGDRWTPSTYAQALADGWARAEAAAHAANPEIPAEEVIIPKWTSHQLRHTAAQRVSREFGLEAARALLGHRHANLTALYAAVDVNLASEVAAKIG